MRVNNPYAMPDELRQRLDESRRMEESWARRVEAELLLQESLEQEKQKFRLKIEPLLLNYHKDSADIYSGRRKDVFKEACRVISSTSPSVLNSDFKIGLRSFSKQIALLGDRELIQYLINCGFNPDLSFAPNDSLRDNLESLCDFFFKQSLDAVNVQGLFFKNCLDVLPSRYIFQDRLVNLLLSLHKNYEGGRVDWAKQRAKRYAQIQVLLSTVSPDELNDCKIEGRDLGLHLGLMGDSVLLQIFLRSNLDSDKVFFDKQFGQCRLEDFLNHKKNNSSVCAKGRYARCLDVLHEHKHLQQVEK